MAETQSLVELQKEFVEIGKSMKIDSTELQTFVKESLDREAKWRAFELKRAEAEHAANEKKMQEEREKEMVALEKEKLEREKEKERLEFEERREKARLESEERIKLARLRLEEQRKMLQRLAPGEVILLEERDLRLRCLSLGKIRTILMHFWLVLRVLLRLRSGLRISGLYI